MSDTWRLGRALSESPLTKPNCPLQKTAADGGAAPPGFSSQPWNLRVRGLRRRTHSGQRRRLHHTGAGGQLRCGGEKRKLHQLHRQPSPRPAHGSHALFTGSDEAPPLSKVAEEIAHHPGNVWLPIISLRREDASRLGYDDAERWKSLLTGYAMEIAQAMKIPWDQFRWYAAFHDESHHPHVHMSATARMERPATSPSRGSRTSSPVWPKKSSRTT